jgi:putative exporter of polyketide antibiotics
VPYVLVIMAVDEALITVGACAMKKR